MNDKIDELHLIYKMIGAYGFCTVQELLNKYEASEKARKEAIELIKSKEYVIDLYTFGYELDDYDIFKVKRILDIDKGE